MSGYKWKKKSGHSFWTTVGLRVGRRIIRDLCGFGSLTIERLCAFQIISTLFLVGIYYKMYFVCPWENWNICPDSQTLLHVSIWATKQIALMINRRKPQITAYCRSECLTNALQNTCHVLTVPRPLCLMRTSHFYWFYLTHYLPLDVKLY